MEAVGQTPVERFKSVGVQLLSLEVGVPLLTEEILTSCFVLATQAFVLIGILVLISELNRELTYNSAHVPNSLFEVSGVVHRDRGVFLGSVVEPQA